MLHVSLIYDWHSSQFILRYRVREQYVFGRFYYIDET